MLCLTGAERSWEAVEARLASHPDVGLHEIRLDLLAEPEAYRLSERLLQQSLLLTCRPERQGGAYTGSERQRRDLLMGAAQRLRPAWIDVELDADADLRDSLEQKAREVGSRLLVSHHVLAPVPPDEVLELGRRLARSAADAVKLAVAVCDAAELQVLKDVGASIEQPRVLIGMGSAGLLSRALFPAFGSAWMYVAGDAQSTTAAGQLCRTTFERWRLPPPVDAPLYVLLGGPQIQQSPDPAVYNALFASRQIDARYLPIVTTRARATLDLLGQLGLAGASVTTPLKHQVVELVDEVDETAARLGAINTITVKGDGRLWGTNTDGAGALAAIVRHAGPVTGQRAVVLGAGATAAAIANSLVHHGAKVTLLGRDAGKVARLASRLRVHGGTLDELPGLDCDIVVHATPVGTNDREATLVPHREFLRGKVVLDVVLSRDTRLLRDARTAGATVVTGRAMWAEQGRRQLERWLNLEIAAQELEVDP